MATKTIKLIDARALDVFIVLEDMNYNPWSAKKLIELYVDTINEDFEKNKTPEQIAKHIVQLYMKD
jgi:hypothetical protein